MERSAEVGLGRQRLFVAIELSKEILEELSTVRDECQAAGLRLAPIHQTHLTLLFLSDFPCEMIPRLTQALKKPCANAFPLRLKVMSVGLFGSDRAATVLFAGVKDPEGDLEELHQNVLLACRKIGFSPLDERSFHPHITLARARKSSPPNPREVAAISSRWRNFLFGPWQPAGMTLFRSEAGEGGRLYTELRRYP